MEVRIGITTGEALIALEARPDAGEGIASGDVVNTAARLQSAAPAGGILVDAATHRASERAIEYAERAPVVAKGKAEPVAVWQALRARTALGAERPRDAPLVGRTEERTLLRETLARVLREREPQLITLVGVPGIGKSRLVAELLEEERGDERALSLQGHSLPYGEGVTFWALGEMVKGHAGILESDTADETAEKLSRVVTDVIAEPADAARVERHLRPLAGLETERHRGGRSPQRGLRGLAALSGGTRRAPAAGARLRGSALGRRRPARLRRPPARLGHGRADPRAGDRPAGAARPPARPGAAARSTPRPSGCLRSPTPRRGRSSTSCSGARRYRRRRTERCSSAPAETRCTPRSSRGCWATGARS